MNITERAKKVLSEIDAALEYALRDERTGWPLALRCLKTAIEGLLKLMESVPPSISTADAAIRHDCVVALTTICEQWEAGR